MTTIRISIQLLKASDNLPPNRVQMDITDKLLKIHIFLAHNGFISILKKYPGAVVPAVESHCITGEQLSH